MRGCSERSARRSEAGSGLRQGGNAYGSWRGAPKERKGDGLVRSSLGRAAATALVLAAGAAIAGTSTAAERVALVIGNGAYQHTVPLRNPRNDAGAVARQLRNLGFEVIEGLDLDEAAFEARLREFSRAAANAETTLFFYAGHGLQVDGQNYLVPVDAELAEEVDLRWDAVPLGNVIAEMRSEVNLVFLDACRDNPLARNLAGSMGSSRSAAVGRGLGRVESVSGTLIAYATQPGNVADDGDGENSPFTAALVANLAAPGLSVNDLMTSVTDAVATRTNGVGSSHGRILPCGSRSTSIRWMRRRQRSRQLSARRWTLSQPRQARCPAPSHWRRLRGRHMRLRSACTLWRGTRLS